CMMSRIVALSRLRDSVDLDARVISLPRSCPPRPGLRLSLRPRRPGAAVRLRGTGSAIRGRRLRHGRRVRARRRRGGSSRLAARRVKQPELVQEVQHIQDRISELHVPPYLPVLAQRADHVARHVAERDHRERALFADWLALTERHQPEPPAAARRRTEVLAVPDQPRDAALEWLVEAGIEAPQRRVEYALVTQ